MSEARQPFASVRRVTTGHDAEGRAVVVRDEIVPREKGLLLAWAADVAPVAGESPAPAYDQWWPPPGGVRVSLSTRAPDASSQERPQDRAWPDINDAAGFHASCSTDVIVMIEGSIWLELDDGVEVALKAGDVLVQNGTRHRWRNRSDQWPLMATIIVGARPA